jgi:thiol:disulfide interchange protein
LEKANELYEIATTKKVGNSVFELRAEIEEKKRKFHKAKFPDKIKKFEVKQNFKKFLEVLNAVNKARNCYEHRNGVLGKEDCNSGQKLILNFRFPAAVSTAGRPIGIFDTMPMSEKFQTQFVEERKVFRVNQKLDLGFNDSYKLLYTINFTLKGIIDHIYECSNMDKQVRILKQFKC